MVHQIEAVLFDMGGTLRSTRKRSRDERLRFTGEILNLLGSDADPVDFSHLLARRATAYRRWARETMIELNEADLWARWMLPDWPEAQVRKHAVQLNLLWREATGERVVFPETAEVVLELFRRGYRLGLVSNTTSSTEAPLALKKLGLTGCFETMILSAVVGALNLGAGGLTLGTFHAVCARFLRIEGEHIGVPRSFVIFDEITKDRIFFIIGWRF